MVRLDFWSGLLMYAVKIIIIQQHCSDTYGPYCKKSVDTVNTLSSCSFNTIEKIYILKLEWTLTKLVTPVVTGKKHALFCYKTALLVKLFFGVAESSWCQNEFWGFLLLNIIESLINILKQISDFWPYLSNRTWNRSKSDIKMKLIEPEIWNVLKPPQITHNAT